jgi:hypothetical protein
MSMYDFNSTFFLSVGTLLITASSVCLGYALKSKCSNVKCCYGCFEIVRDIDAELEIEENAVHTDEPSNMINPQSHPPFRRRMSRDSTDNIFNSNSLDQNINTHHINSHRRSFDNTTIPITI